MVAKNHMTSRDKKQILRTIRDKKIDYLRIVWTDFAGHIRTKALYKDVLETKLEKGVELTKAGPVLAMPHDAIAWDDGLPPVGDANILGDPKTFHQIPYCKKHAAMLGNMHYDGQPWEYCPRTILQKMIAKAKKANIEFKTGLETEFILLQDKNNITPADNTLFSESLALDIHQDFIDDLTQNIKAQGMKIRLFHAESAPGQLEFSLEPSDPLTTADNQVRIRQTVRTIAMKHGLWATFATKVFPDAGANSCHLHMSIWRKGKQIFFEKHADNGISSLVTNFVGGVLEHLPAIMAISAPTINSYARFQKHCWSGMYQAWGWHNREAAIRMLKYANNGHFELKSVDATANYYLVMAAVIAAGLDGIEQGTHLPEPINVDPGNLPDDELAQRQIKPLPENLQTSVNAFEKDQAFRNAFGDNVVNAIAAVRRYDLELMKDWDFDKQLRLLIERF